MLVQDASVKDFDPKYTKNTKYNNKKTNFG